VEAKDVHTRPWKTAPFFRALLAVLQKNDKKFQRTESAKRRPKMCTWAHQKTPFYGRALLQIKHRTALKIESAMWRPKMCTRALFNGSSPKQPYDKKARQN